MRPVATPFRASSRSSGGPQFASTPRFFVSQRTPASQQATQDAFSTEDDGPQSTPVPTARFLRRDRGAVSTPRQKEIIEDSDDTEDNQQDDTPHVRSGEIIFDDGQTQSSSPVPPAEQDSEFEDLFAIIQERKKRRRISANNGASPSQPVATQSDTDRIVSLSQDHPASPTPQFQSPTPAAPKQSSIQTQATPAPSHRTLAATATPRPTAPASINTTTNPRRFLFSTSHLPPSTQPQPRSKPWVSTSTQEPPPSSQRRKPPAFVLPRSPSPSHMDDELAALPTPFSPSSRALRRRGRARGPAHAYLPDGMAAEVRSWVLEIGTRHEQQRQTSVARRTGADTPGQDPRYSPTVVRIESVHQSSLPSCGPLAFVCGHETDALGDEARTEAETDSRLRKLLLIGSPRSRSETTIQPRRRVASIVPELRPGNAIGICRGLTWDIDLGESDIGVGIRDNHSINTALQASGKWTVVLEWELVSEVDGQDRT
ncbi:hypothetical protein BO86DRAFT_368605 [Aspergillus japonicus CBS 114.51]|uniref:Uncharacterized protein n=1 Tax=Aspergillus japonicus CBS 114.51 TaxID=1448312 RepID=A0A8T8WRR1_ASPJA|nr:hypothetical protein BO86DRAFT_368605 [Aspergillus japonicus CBS 114.51]RAH78507.1 hypothetical protein BO86DRAFT_368605 [Aspergillus japonicus CBS 114.51]